MKKSKTDGAVRSKSISCEKQSANRRVSKYRTTSQPSCSYETGNFPNADKTKVVKTLIRNPTDKSKVRVKIPESYEESISLSGSKETEDVTPSCSSSVVGSTDDCDLKVPSLCTALRVADNIVTAAVESRSNLLCDLARSSKTCITKKAIRKVNFPPEKHLYKDLVNLQITDDEIAAKCTKTSSKVKDIGKKKDPVPKLSDFYVPTFSEEFTVPPNPVKFRPEKIQYYDGHAIINRMKTWEPKN